MLSFWRQAVMRQLFLKRITTRAAAQTAGIGARASAHFYTRKLITFLLISVRSRKENVLPEGVPMRKVHS